MKRTQAWATVNKKVAGERKAAPVVPIGILRLIAKSGELGGQASTNRSAAERSASAKKAAPLTGATLYLEHKDILIAFILTPFVSMERCFRDGLRAGTERRQCNAFDNSDRSANFAAHRRIADLAIQCKWAMTWRFARTVL